MTKEPFDIEKDADFLAVSLSFFTGVTHEEIKPQIIAFAQKLFSQGREQGIEEAAEMAVTLNYSVHPECGRSVKRAILSIKSKEVSGKEGT